MYTLLRIRLPNGHLTPEEGERIVQELAWLRPACLSETRDGVILALASGGAAAQARRTLEVSRRHALELATWRLSDAKAAPLLATVTIPLANATGFTIAPAIDWKPAYAIARSKPTSKVLLPDP
jgi:hypothetical protein